MKEQLNWQRIVMITPAIAFFIIFALGPMVMAGYFSFLDWNGVAVPKFTGFSNWINVFTDKFAGMSMLLTLKMMILTWVIQTPISLLLGVFLAGKQRYRSILGVFYFFPLLFSSAAIGITWSYILNPNFGLVNSLFHALGLSSLAKDWIGNPQLALYTIAVVIAWQFIPFHTLLYQAGTRQIPDAIYEAAEIDGATGIKKFFHITLPQLKYTITTSSLLMLTGSLTYFDLVYVMTGGGPGNATMILPMYMYKTAFMDQRMGYGSVLAIILAVIGILLSLVMLKITGFNKMESQMEGV
ncbi:sugar ABC transporter permease [Fodinisporobacter ferrooxydans]|uniref:Sugar ABC transporter permease n=1 Tax=Fodinisporobacter ferrooxydans TaxID=2901836 RepID=A0ABY4CE55_9BACL|nr:sugar ABC transporter permease [Alicyclobacillaceae bacterium MYW30-H2]